jgi:rhodanese-related sulfurtransferase
MKASHPLRLGLFLLLAATLATATARADHLTTVSVIDAAQLKQWIDGGTAMTLVDSRVAAEYKAGHIPTAVNILAATMEQHRARLPANKNAVLVFYCNGWPECKKSHDAAAKAVQWGYQKVYWMREGLPAWQAKGFPVE